MSYLSELFVDAGTHQGVFVDALVPGLELEAFNPNRDEKGRYTFGTGTDREIGREPAYMHPLGPPRPDQVTLAVRAALNTIKDHYGQVRTILMTHLARGIRTATTAAARVQLRAFHTALRVNKTWTKFEHYCTHKLRVDAEHLVVHALIEMPDLVGHVAHAAQHFFGEAEIEAGNPNHDDKGRFTFAPGTAADLQQRFANGLGLIRDDLPQIPGRFKQEFLNDLRRDGVSVVAQEVNPATLAPTQRTYNPAWTNQISERVHSGVIDLHASPVLISQDGHVLDGHHRWVAALMTHEMLPVIRVGLSPTALIQRGLAFGETHHIDRRAEDAVVNRKLAACAILASDLEHVVAHDWQASGRGGRLPEEIKPFLEPALHHLLTERGDGTQPTTAIMGTHPFATAQRMALTNDQLQYVEGYVVDPAIGFPIHHGWVEDQTGHVIDVSRTQYPGTQYYGTPIDTALVHQSWLHGEARPLLPDLVSSDVHAYGTPEGATKAWDTRGRSVAGGGNPEGPAVGSQTHGAPRGDWNSVYYSFPDNGAWTAEAVHTVDLKDLPEYHTRWFDDSRALDLPFAAAGDHDGAKGLHWQRDVLREAFAGKLPSTVGDRELIAYRLGHSPEKLAGRNGGTLEGVLDHLAHTEDKQLAAGDRITAYHVTLLKPMGEYGWGGGGHIRDKYFGQHVDDVDAFNPYHDDRGKFTTAGSLAADITDARSAVGKRIGEIPRGASRTGWQNTATTPEQLYADAKVTEPVLRSVVGQAAQTSGGEANFGPEGAHAVKEIGSLRDKIEKEAKAGVVDPVRTIGDAVRGSVIVDRPEQVAPAAESVRQAVEAQGGSISFDNKFGAWNRYGYGAVHADAIFPLRGGGTMRAEVQVHLREIHDGTKDSAKETAHVFYKQYENKQIDRATAIHESQRIYLAAFQRVLRS